MFFFYYTECLMIKVCIMLLEGQLLKKNKVINYDSLLALTTKHQITTNLTI